MGFVDLHLHMDGSLPVDTVIKLAKQQSIELPTYNANELKDYLTVSRECRSLNEYLEKFELPLLLLQTKESIQTAIFDIAKTLSEENIEYAEIRFAPQLHTRKGLSQEEIVSIAEGSAAKASEKYKTKLRLILCCMRGNDNNSLNLETVLTAAKFDRRIVAGIDIAGAEEGFPTSMFSDLFEKARELNIPFTVHAGEAGGPENVREAIRLGAKRIGHGIHAANDEELMDIMAQKGIFVEMCPTSNLQTKAVERLSDYPLRKFLEKGIKATINTDNMTVSGTTINKEFELLRREYGLTKEEENILIENAREARL